MEDRIYLDHNATTPVDPRVLEVMLPFFGAKFGNAASRQHSFGREAKAAVDAARQLIADELMARPREIIFTSGATESVNLAIKGLGEKNIDRGRHIITQVTEHKAVLDSCAAMERRGWEVTYLPVEKNGRVDPQGVARTIRKDTLLVAVMQANNEIGVLQPVEEIGALCKEQGVFFLVDASQSLGKLAIDVEALGVDLLAGSGHKIYGPKGVGFLYVRRKDPRTRLQVQLEGGGHEEGLRSGTLAVPLIVGLGEALKLCAREREAESRRLLKLRERLMKGVLKGIPEAVVNGSLEHRLANNLNFSFPYVEGEALLRELKTVVCSSGSACTTTTLEPSYVLKALGHSEELAHSSIRFGLGHSNTAVEIDRAVEEVVTAVRHLREKSPFWELVQASG